MRPHQDAAGSQRRIGAGANGGDPALDESGLRGAAGKERRADVEQERFAVGQAGGGAERVACAAGAPSEPVVEALGAGHHHMVGRNPVQPDGLVALDLVPHEHAIGRVANQRLAGQVIPAPYGHGRRQLRGARGAQVVGLRRAHHADERGDQQGVRLLLAQIGRHVAAGRDGRLGAAQQPAEQRARGGHTRPRAVGEAHRKRWCALRRTRPQARRAVVGRLEVAQQVDPPPQPCRHRRPLASLAPRRFSRGDAGIRGGQAIEQRRAAHRLPALDGQVHLVPTFRPQPDHRLEVAEVVGVAGEEQQPHAWRPTTRLATRPA